MLPCTPSSFVQEHADSKQQVTRLSCSPCHTVHVQVSAVGTEQIIEVYIARPGEITPTILYQADGQRVLNFVRPIRKLCFFRPGNMYLATLPWGREYGRFCSKNADARVC